MIKRTTKIFERVYFMNISDEKKNLLENWKENFYASNIMNAIEGTIEEVGTIKVSLTKVQHNYDRLYKVDDYIIISKSEDGAYKVSDNFGTDDSLYDKIYGLMLEPVQTLNVISDAIKNYNETNKKIAEKLIK